MTGPRKAVALRYEKQRDMAPRVIAKGSGAVAEAIIQAAKNADVPTQENEDLVRALLTLEVDAVIPEELYAIVAEVLAFVYRAKGK